jgi:hypothetical protein
MNVLSFYLCLYYQQFVLNSLYNTTIYINFKMLFRAELCQAFGFNGLWVGGERGYGRMGGRREETRGEYRVMKLMKQNKKGKITLSLTSKEKYFLFTYDVITSPEKEQRSANQYSHTPTPTHTQTYTYWQYGRCDTRARTHTHTHIIPPTTAILLG